MYPPFNHTGYPGAYQAPGPARTATPPVAMPSPSFPSPWSPKRQPYYAQSTVGYPPSSYYPNSGYEGSQPSYPGYPSDPKVMSMPVPEPYYPSHYAPASSPPAPWGYNPGPPSFPQPAPHRADAWCGGFVLQAPSFPTAPNYPYPPREKMQMPTPCHAPPPFPSSPAPSYASYRPSSSPAPTIAESSSGSSSPTESDRGFD